RPPANAATGSAISDDLLVHMEGVGVKLVTASANLHRAENQVSRSLPGVERNYLLVEKQRLESALASAEAARRDLEQTRQEFDLILNSMKKEHN
ncbi:MAG TPA: hypothetical protein VFB00_08170, partial [Terriglobales bacterium]|nr:hypothetical protein [Terriglobales bacterium]